MHCYSVHLCLTMQESLFAGCATHQLFLLIGHPLILNAGCIGDDKRGV